MYDDVYYFRKYFPECGFTNYREALNGTLPISDCLRRQLRSGPIDLYSLEEIYILIVPSINDSPELVAYKDDIRNKFKFKTSKEVFIELLKNHYADPILVAIPDDDIGCGNRHTLH